MIYLIGLSCYDQINIWEDIATNETHESRELWDKIANAGDRYSSNNTTFFRSEMEIHSKSRQAGVLDLFVVDWQFCLSLFVICNIQIRSV